MHISFRLLKAYNQNNEHQTVISDKIRNSTKNTSRALTHTSPYVITYHLTLEHHSNMSVVKQ
jgi:hypothetical protein